MPNNYILLERIELNASAASITFSNIPQTGYTDLKIVASARTDDPNTGTIANLKFNSNTSSYSSRFLNGRGDSFSSGTGSTSAGDIGRFPGVNSPVTDNVFSNTEIYVPNYTSSNFKSYSSDAVTEANQTISYATLTAGLWSNTAAITSITIASSAGSIVANSTFSLYGLAALGTTPVIAPKASGGSIYTDGTYWYHAFRTSGTFTPQVALSADVLVIAGGGGAGTGGGGGGGAGGLIGFTSQSLAVSSYACTIGSGGADRTTGNDSQFGALTLVKGGGRGAQDGGVTAAVGGSGGGGASGGSNRTGGAGTSGQGFAGGDGSNLGVLGAGGGGGATSVGGTGSGTVSGAGGTASSAYSSWASATSTGVSGAYAGGGGGATYYAGAGGAGGGGGGGAGTVSGSGQGVAGTINTGGGGGGSAGGAGAAGGSGIIIVRYTIA